MAATNAPIWITGAHGLIGNYLVQSAINYAPGKRVIGIGRRELDLANSSGIQKLFKEQSPAGIIHCAAISKTPACQADPTLAHAVNVEATKILAELAAELPFFFFSTDLVFDGQSGNYDERSTVNPLSVYAETKVAAEQFVLMNPKHVVLRTSLNAGISPTGDRGFNEEMRQMGLAGKTINLFVDEFRCPIPAVVTARAVWELFHRNVGGLFHLAGSERLSRFEIGKLIAAQWPELEPLLKAGTLKEYSGAPRAPDTSLDCRKVQNHLSFPLPAFSAWLASNRGQLGI